MSARFVASCGCGWSRAYASQGRADLYAARHVCPEPPRRHRRSCRGCGWAGSYSSAAMADWAKRLHSCARNIARAEQRARGDARHAAVDRTPRPCLHKRTTHVHGTHACYVLDRCKCVPCTRANSDYERQRSRLQAYGRWNGYVDAQPARDHVQALMRNGMGLKRIHLVSGVAHGVLWRLLYGKRRPDGTRTPSRWIRPATADRLLAVELDLAGGVVVDGTDTTRRVQALIALGWSQAKLADRLDIGYANFTPIVHGRRRVRLSTAEAVYDLYCELVHTTPPESTHHDKIAASRARRSAAGHGWQPPLTINGRPWVGLRPSIAIRREAAA